MNIRLPTIWLGLLVITTVFQVALLMSRQATREVPVFLTMIDVIPEQQLDSEEATILADKVREDGIDLGRVYTGIGRIGATVSIDDLALGLDELLHHDRLQPSARQRARILNQIKQIHDHRQTLEECQLALIQAERNSRNDLSCLLELLSEAEINALLVELGAEGLIQ